ncbi:MAG: sugar phosphate isomerase/epimerase family protein [Phycisphaerae bacterium]|jgi:sugar phosphate isomerase/epimerase
MVTRRDTLKAALASSLVLPLAACARAASPGASTRHEPVPPATAPLFPISLAQWSLHNALFKGDLDHLDFPKVAAKDYGIFAVEYVNAFFKKKNSVSYVRTLKRRCEDAGVKSVLIMCDGEGHTGDPDEKARLKAVDNHRKWIDAAVALGCHSIRVNAQSSGDPEEQARLCADGLRRLCEIGDKAGINVIVENHGGLSSNGAWLAGVMKRVDHPRVGTLPDFGNFRIAQGQEYDRYQGVAEMMPFAKGVSAKSHDFDDRGEETTKDYRRLIRIMLDAGYRGHLGIEYEGSRLSEPDGIRATKKLIETVRAEFAARA